MVHVVIHAKTFVVGILALHPAIDELVNVVEVVLASATLLRYARSIGVSHAKPPAVITPNGSNYITAVLLQEIRKECSCGPDVVVDVLAIVIGGVFALFRGNLHETLLTSTTDGIWVAIALLHRERCEYDLRDSMFRSVLFESSNGFVTATGECCMPYAVQRDDYHFMNLNGSWRPTGTIDPAIQPLDVAIRAAHRRDLRRCADGIALAMFGGIDYTLGRWRVVRIRFLRGVIATPEKRIIVEGGCSGEGDSREPERERDEPERELHGRLRSVLRNECG